MGKVMLPFWKRVTDELYKRKLSFKGMCSSLDLKYITMMNQKNIYNRIPKPKQIEKISKYLNVTTDYLLNGENIIIKEDPIFIKSKNNPKLHAIFVYYADMTDDKIDSYYHAFGLDTKEKRESEKSAT